MARLARPYSALLVAAAVAALALTAVVIASAPRLVGRAALSSQSQQARLQKLAGPNEVIHRPPQPPHRRQTALLSVCRAPAAPAVEPDAHRACFAHACVRACDKRAAPSRNSVCTRRPSRTRSRPREVSISTRTQTRTRAKCRATSPTRTSSTLARSVPLRL